MIVFQLIYEQVIIMLFNCSVNARIKINKFFNIVKRYLRIIIDEYHF
ncbi:hypothetical protein A1OE_338 [Candidatus Endolissoclinum faulkneri L2]|uniref:Uncharacterized protein n=1 Tax=Candidatus Endolissoclinum faulkneri L2 TaxID=1193729 RepID=K7YPN7_9PROT|nr:hypothetical protein A1OE_338 [Candidatus Endolissoclinum faulkneri L2]